MTHSNGFLHVSKDVQYRLKIAGMTALVIGTGWYLHKCYKTYYNTQDTPPSNHDIENKADEFVIIEQYSAKSKADEANIYIPVIKVYDAVYGISRIELNNLTGQETDFQIEINHKNNIQLHNFNIYNIGIDREEDKEYIHIRLPLRLNDYSIQFRIRCKLKSKTGDFWSAFSLQSNLNIPSSLISKKFKLNEKVTFVPKGSNYGSKGTIIKILDSDSTLYVIQEFNWSLNDTKDHIVHFSRIYRNGPYLYNVIDANNKTQSRMMNKSVLLDLNEDDEKYAMELMDVFDILSEMYKEQAEEMEIDIDVHYVFIGRFVAKNVIDFLLNNSGKHNLVNCMMEYNHRFMKIVSVWNNSVRNAIELNEMGVKVIPKFENSSWCDLCGMEISKFDWIYRCDTDVTDRHFFCLRCVWDIIQQHKQLTEFLKQYLRKYLYDVCIEEISSFVCGAVVYCH